MNELLEELRLDFENEDVRYGYVEAFLNTRVAAQIKALRERRGMKQEELAEKIGTKQSGISRLENVNYSSWNIETLRKLARALRVRLRISFEEFASLIPELENFKATLTPLPFEKDPVFGEPEDTNFEPLSPEDEEKVRHLLDFKTHVEEDQSASRSLSTPALPKSIIDPFQGESDGVPKRGQGIALLRNPQEEVLSATR